MHAYIDFRWGAHFPHHASSTRHLLPCEHLPQFNFRNEGMEISISRWSWSCSLFCKQIALKGSFKFKALFTFSRRCLETGDTKKLCVFNLGQMSNVDLIQCKRIATTSLRLGTPPHPDARWICHVRNCRIRDPQGKVPGHIWKWNLAKWCEHDMTTSIHRSLLGVWLRVIGKCFSFFLGFNGFCKIIRWNKHWVRLCQIPQQRKSGFLR